MKKYEIVLENNVITNYSKDKVYYIKWCFIKIYQTSQKIYIRVNELIFSSLEIIILNTKNNTYIFIKRNENCFLDIKGQINTRLRGKYYNNRYLFNNCYFKLKIKKICKIKELDDLSIFKINIKGIAYFKNINSKIELNSENSLIITRYYD